MKRILPLIALISSGCYRDLDIGICQTNPSDPICSEDATADSTSRADALADGTAAEVAVDTSLADGSSDPDASGGADAGTVNDAGDASAPSDTGDAAPSCADAGPASESCGKCGTRTRTCIAEGTWSAWGGCESEGVCTPGEVADVTGGTACPGVLEKKTKTCAASCTWGADTCALPKGWTAIADVPASYTWRSSPSSGSTGSTIFLFGGGVTLESVAAVPGAIAYDLGTNAWRTLPSTTLLPEGRRFSAAATSGNHFIVWGGRSTAGVHATGARYRLNNDTWEAMATSPLSARTATASTWIPTTGTLFVFGGEDAALGAKSDGATYDPAKDEWVLLPNAPISARAYASCVWTGSEVAVWGGRSDPNEYADGALFNPVSRTWRTMPSGSPTARVAAFAAATDDAQFIVFGASNGGSPSGGVLSGGLTPMWRPIPSPTSGRLAPSVWVSGRRLYAWSGVVDGGDGGTAFTSEGEAFDTGTGTWAPFDQTNAPSGRLAATIVTSANGVIVVEGLRADASSNVEYLRSGALWRP